MKNDKQAEAGKWSDQGLGVLFYRTHRLRSGAFLTIQSDFDLSVWKRFNGIGIDGASLSLLIRTNAVPDWNSVLPWIRKLDPTGDGPGLLDALLSKLL